MTTDRVWAFPVLALALSPRGGALVVFERPLRVSERQSWRKSTWRYVERACASLQPRTILVTHGARFSALAPVWRAAPRHTLPAGVQRETLRLEDACTILGCDARLPAIAARLLDMYPEQAARLRCFGANPRSDRARASRPLLSAFAVAHAASIAHLIKFG